MFTLFEAAKRMRNPLSVGLMKNIVTEDELFSVLPFVPKDGDSFSYEREKALPGAEWVDPAHTSLSESTASTDLVTVPKREISSNMDIRSFTLAQQDGARQLGMQIMQKGKAVGRELARALIRGVHVTGYSIYQSTDPFSTISGVVAGPFLDSVREGPGELQFDLAGTQWRFRAPRDRDFGEYVDVSAGAGSYLLRSDNPSKYVTITITGVGLASGRSALEFTTSSNEPDGLNQMIVPSQVRSSTGVNGDAYDLGILDRLINMVKVKENRAFIMNGDLLEKHYEQLRASGGMTSRELELPTYTDGRASTRKVPTYRGIPILQNDFIESTEVKGGSSTLSSIYLASLGGDMNADGNPKGLYAGAFGGSSLQVDVDPISRIVLGLQMVHVGHLENSNSQRWRSNWYGAFALGSNLAAARASEIETV